MSQAATQHQTFARLSGKALRVSLSLIGQAVSFTEDIATSAFRQLQH